MELFYHYEGNILPKARPRYCFKTRTTYMPKRYTKWRGQFEKFLVDATPEIMWGLLPLIDLKIEIILYGKIIGDLDNLSGGILDSLVTRKIIEDDRISCVKELLIKHSPSAVKACDVKLQGLSIWTQKENDLPLTETL